jgi:hypothetical protein
MAKKRAAKRLSAFHHPIARLPAGELDHVPASDELMEALPHISSVLRLLEVNLASIGEIDPKLLCELGSLLASILRGVPANKLFRQDERTKPKKDWSNLAVAYYFLRACAEDVTDDSNAIATVKAAETLGAPNSDELIRKSVRAFRLSVLNALEENGDLMTQFVFLVTRSARYQQLLHLYNFIPQAVALANGDPAVMSQIQDAASKHGFTAQDAAELEKQRLDWQRYHLTAKKVAKLREYLRKKSAHMRG